MDLLLVYCYIIYKFIFVSWSKQKKQCNEIERPTLYYGSTPLPSTIYSRDSRRLLSFANQQTIFFSSSGLISFQLYGASLIGGMKD